MSLKAFHRFWFYIFYAVLTLEYSKKWVRGNILHEVELWVGCHIYTKVMWEFQSHHEGLGIVLCELRENVTTETSQIYSDCLKVALMHTCMHALS